MEFHVILTLAQSAEDGGNYATINRIVKANPGNTRKGLLNWAFQKAPEGFEGANIVFFSAEPNVLPSSESEVGA
ncbi:hypothetical protein ACFQVD_26260 [Streptosporangium amethystogenes subsp. fukuiense]|uniref:Uncharacterized protein n=1 Tax=Streptosporangium amethystogenes subsp. fukuiense TaxID=698418 RepID=A0ABW2T5B8_9ACTN